jgi:olefin beta-lactone synthetase
VANIGSEAILNETRFLTDQGRGVCVGRPVPGMQVRIIPISDEPIPAFAEDACLPPGEVGEIVISGPVVTVEYFGRPQATALAKMRDASRRLWHRMGDVGYLDESGRLWYCGRKSQRVVTPDGTLFTDQVEPVFNAVPGVFRTALIGVTSRGVTHPVIAVELDDDVPGIDPWPEVYEALRAAARRHEHTRRIEVFLEHPGSFPVDVRHNSKIFRELLVPWAASEMDWRRLPPEPQPAGAAR